MNYVNVFLNPRKAVQDAFAESNPSIAVSLNILQVIFFTFVLLILGQQLNLPNTILFLVNSLITTFLFAGILFLISEYVIKIVMPKTKMKHKLFGLAHAFSLIFIYLIVLNILVVLPYFVLPGLQQPIQSRAQGIITDEEFIVQLNQAVDLENPLIGAFSLILTILNIVLLLYVFYFLYLIVSELFQLGFLRNLGIYFVMFIVLYILMILKSYLF